ncbi:MAG: hypothetical protein ACREIA_07695 [Opitutaceae bacterium]
MKTKSSRYSEESALEALAKIEHIESAPRAAGFPDVCREYRRIKPLLETILPFVSLIPVFGAKVVAAIRLLMRMLEQLCGPAAGLSKAVKR